MSTFSNKSVISWPQKHATDASYRKPAATKRGCVSSYHQKKIHKPKQMWTTIVSRCLPQKREQIWFRKEMMQSTDPQIRNISARPTTATKESKITGKKGEGRQHYLGCTMRSRIPHCYDENIYWLNHFHPDAVSSGTAVWYFQHHNCEPVLTAGWLHRTMGGLLDMVFSALPQLLKSRCLII